MWRFILCGFSILFWTATAVAEGAAMPPAPNRGPVRSADCPPNMLGTWRPISQIDRDIYGDATITSDAIEWTHLGRFGLSSAEPLLDGIDWSKAEFPGLSVSPERIKNYTGQLLKLDRPIVVPEDRIDSYQYIRIHYGGPFSGDYCGLQITICDTKISAAYSAAGMAHFAYCSSISYKPRPPGGG